MNTYILTNNAKFDFASIYTYTTENFGYHQWQKYNAFLHKKFQTIVDIPTIGNQNHMSKQQIKNNLYKITAGKHYIFYTKNPKTHNIDIIALVHTSRDIKRALSNRYLNYRTEPI